MNKENIVYVKIKNGIFKCYKSEQMHKPIYYPVESKTNGYIDYNDVEKILTIEDLYQENQELKKQLEEYKDNYNCLLKQKEQFEYIMSKQVDYLGQKKEFIKYLENEIKERKIQIVGYHPTTQLLIEQIIETEKMVLSKYKEIIGVSDENTIK